MRDALRLVDDWPVDHVAAAAIAGDAVTTHGPVTTVFALASVTKVLTAFAVLVAVEEGSLTLDTPAGPPGATVADLLAHASGLAPDGDRALAPPRTRRIYSNRGYEVLGEVLAGATGIDAGAYIAEAVLEPLGMTAAVVPGSPAASGQGTVADLARLVAEWRHPRLVSPATRDAMWTPWAPALAGVVPGFGHHDPNPWGLGPEVRGAKAPHWTGTTNDPTTVGHFGRAGGFLWLDPVADRALVVLTDRPFGPWAAAAWPVLADAVLAA